jgi:DNA-binding protein YbaB
MFGDLFGAMGKLKDLKSDVAQVKARLDQTGVRTPNRTGSIVIQGNANKKVEKIEIHPELLQSPSQLEQELIEAFNQFVAKAEAWQQEEIQKTIQSKLPQIPGIENLFK